MAYRDLREFIRRLEADGELRRVAAQVDWHLEIGAISRRGLDLRAPALLFENVKDHPGTSVLANLLGPTSPVLQGRVALALALPKDTPSLAIIDEFARRLHERIKPIVVDTGPCKEVIVKGEGVDLLRLPSPFIHAMDGGRYLGTWHVDVIKDPDSGWVNWGMYRHMLHDEKTLGWLAMPFQHGPRLYYDKYEARDLPMPMAIAIGTEPVTSMIAGCGVAEGVNEADIVGGMRGEPVELVKCETIDLEVPATAEIVLEGYVTPRERKLEGPFGEYTGYSAGGRSPRPVFHVQCITHRKDPILTMSNMGKPYDDDGVLGSISLCALLSNELKARGIQASVYAPAPRLAVIVAVKQTYAGYVHTVASAIWASKPGMERPMIIMVGEDVDITNLEDVFWCLTTRLHPRKGIHIIEGAPAHALMPFLTDEERKRGVGNRLILDATFPPDMPPERLPQVIDFQHAWPVEVQEKVLRRWSEYGI